MPINTNNSIIFFPSATVSADPKKDLSPNAVFYQRASTFFAIHLKQMVLITPTTTTTKKKQQQKAFMMRERKWICQRIWLIKISTLCDFFPQSSTLKIRFMSTKFYNYARYNFHFEARNCLFIKSTSAKKHSTQKKKQNKSKNCQKKF